MSVLREAFQTEERGVDVRSGLAGAAASVAPLAIGFAAGNPIAGVIAAIGGLNAALCIPRAGLRMRITLGAVEILGAAAALALADAVVDDDAALILVTLLWVGLWALFRATGPAGALLGFAVGVQLVIFAGLPGGSSADRIGWFALGAIPGGILMIAARSGEGAPKQWTLDRALLRHAARLAVAVAGGTMLYRLADLPHGYWVPLTTLAVLQPGAHSTLVRSLQRAAGTLVAGTVVVVVTFVTDSRWSLTACAAIAAFFLYAIRERGYFWLVVLLTPTALFMLSAVEFEGEAVAFDRVADSMLGILIGLGFAEAARLVGEAIP